MNRLLTITTLFITLFFSSFTKALGISDFTTSYNNSYQFDNNNTAHVTQVISIKNNLSHIYPTIFDIAISSLNLKNIKVSVNQVSVAPQTDESNKSTLLHIPITHPSIGQGQTTEINLTYDSANFVEQIGNTYNLTLPKINRANEAASFVRTVTVPDSYPPLSFSSEPYQTEAIDGVTIYTFDGAGDKSLTLHFGIHATYELKLSYQLKNNTSQKAISELALPPDTSYQRIYLSSIDPEPIEIVLDRDGNFLARYSLDPLTKLDVNTNLLVETVPVPTYFDPSTSTPTDSTNYWPNTSNIKNLASQLKTPQNIYNYILDNLSYDYSALDKPHKRLGADNALTQPTQAICTEFTDTFVAIARSTGIPSRAIIGYGYTTNPSLRPQSVSQDILHAYPEYYNPAKKFWYAIDPTWAQTTGGGQYFERLDFAHITFVRWGLDDSYPLPPGSYKTDPNLRQVQVNPVTKDIPDEKYSYKIEGTTLINTSKTSMHNYNINLGEINQNISYLPPYGHLNLTLNKSSSATRIPSWIYPTITSVILITFTVLLLYKRHKKIK